MAKERMENCPAPVIERGIDVVLSLWKVSEKVNAVSPGWQSEGQNDVKALLVSAGVLRLAPRGEESMSPSWLDCVAITVTRPARIQSLNPSNRP
jgi:hypothetical protein